MKRRITSTLLALALLLSLPPLFPLQTQAAEESETTPTTASGTCGENLTWTLDGNGTLTISGHGAIDSRWSPMDVPWRDVRPLIRKAILEDGITNVAPYTFHGCKNLESVSIPNSVTIIDESGFASCKSLKNISIPNNVTYIGQYAFARCNSLTQIDISDSVSTIDECAFEECQNLRIINIPSSVSNMEYAILHCPKLTKISVDPQNKAYSTDENGVLFNKSKTILKVFPSGSGLNVYEIPSSVTLINYSAFYEATSLKTVMIPDSVTTIDSNAFSYCRGLESISIPDSVQSIGADSFCECEKLHSLIIGSHIRDIGMYAFSGCDSLSSIYFTGPAPKISESSDYPPDIPTFPEDVTLRYINGQSGWTSPSWNGFRTSTWSGNGSVNTVENDMILSLNESTSPNEYVLTGSLPDYGTSINVFYALFNSDDQLLSFGEKTIPKEQEASFRATLSSAKEVDHMKIIVLDETSNTPLSPASLITLNKN